MSGHVPIGPGAGGLLAGIAAGRLANARDDIEDLEFELMEANARHSRALANAKGFSTTLRAVMGEIRAADAGTLKARTVSDPGNRDARVLMFDNAAEDELKRLNPRLRYERSSVRK